MYNSIPLYPCELATLSLSVYSNYIEVKEHFESLAIEFDVLLAIQVAIHFIQGYQLCD